MVNQSTSPSSPPPAEATESFAIDVDVAEVYESKFVSSIFGPIAPQFLDVVGVEPGDDVLDVACGTGIVARTVAERIGPGGSVAGVDLNPAMLSVAERLRPDLDWHQGDVADLPFPDEHFDAALCQMAFMFFPDPDAALAEMRRVTRPSGTVAALVPASLDVQPAYRIFVEIAERYGGPDTRSLVGVYWSCGDLDWFTSRFSSAGLRLADQVTQSFSVGFDSVDDFILTEVNGSPLAERLDADSIDRICATARTEMAQWEVPDGFEIPLVCHTVLSKR